MEKILFDSHAHIANALSGEKLERYIEAVEDSPVEYVVDIGYDLESSAAAVKNAAKYPWCYATVGFHPHDVKSMTDEDLVLLKGLAGKPKVVAIGEIGLDYYRNLSPKDVQQHRFREQLRLAIELAMPIAIHDRDANKDVLDILKQEHVFDRERREQLGDAGLLMHCFSGSAEMAEQYVKLGAMISIAGPVTYKNARRPQEVVRAIPIEHLMIETDSPYLTPEPLRGKTNKPANIEFTARKIAEIRGISYEEVARVTNENAKRFYRIER